MDRNRKKNSKKKGQAVVEYVLILTVVLLGLGGLFYRFSKGFQAWGEALLGRDGYIACLMQTGLLPGQARADDCPSLGGVFEAEQTGIPSTIGGGVSPSPRERPNPRQISPPRTKPGSASVSGSRETSGSNSGRTSSSFKNSSSKKKVGSRSRNSLYKPSGSLLSAENEIEKEGLRKRRSKKRNSRSERKSKFKKFKNLSGYNSEQSGIRFRAVHSNAWTVIEKEQEKREKPIALTKDKISKKEITPESKKRKMLINKKLKKKGRKDVGVGAWTFGSIFRVILIICIILAIVLLIGSQTLQVKKSMK